MVWFPATSFFIIALLTEIDQSQALDGDHVCTKLTVEHVEVEETIEVQRTRIVKCSERSCKRKKYMIEFFSAPVIVTRNRTITNIERQCCVGFVERNTTCVHMEESGPSKEVIIDHSMMMSWYGITVIVLVMMFATSAVIVYFLYSKNNKCSRLFRDVRARRSSRTGSVVTVVKKRRNGSKKGKDWSSGSKIYTNIQNDPISVSSVNRYEGLLGEREHDEHIYEVVFHTSLR